MDRVQSIRNLAAGYIILRWVLPMNANSNLLYLILLLAMCPLAPAQWLKVPSQGVPRTKDGKPDLTAPAPRRPDRKPDLSGIWQIETPKHLINLAADFKPGDLPMQPWAEALTKSAEPESTPVKSPKPT